MDRKGKGKQIAGNGSSIGGKKRKGGVEFRDEGLRINKRKNPSVLQFFEESAEVGYYGGSSDEECDIDDFLNDMEVEPEVEASGKDDKGKKGDSSFVFPKEEEINEEEYDKIMEERYKPGSGFVRYAADDVKSSIEMDALIPTAQDPPIWKVKCAIGREKHSVFCLMHKFVELRKIGNKLQILSVFYVEHVKGFIFIEAEKEHDVLEACKNLNGIYATRMVLLPKAEAPNLLTVQKKTKNFSEGTWARVKNGIYKGDLAQVVAVSDTRRKALIKLIPRIDINALIQKYGGGVAVQKGLTPAPRLISSSELEELRPLIQVRRDRDTGLTFEHLDSLMLKDGYLYKKVSLDSLSSWGVIPSKEEILKFTPVVRKETGDVEWISEIYGEEKKKKIIPAVKGGEKGDSSSDVKGKGKTGVGKGEASRGGKGEASRGGKGEASGGEKGEASGGEKGEASPESKSESSYELYNLVCFSRKDFGLIVGVDDKGDGYKVLKEGSDGPVVVTIGKKEMQNGPFSSKFTALDQNNKQISVNDVVKISKGPSEGKQGVVRQVYRGVIYLYVEGEEENGGYFCCKSQSCEKVKLFTDEFNEKTGGFEASAFGAFEDFASSPKSPLSPEKEWQPKEKYINSNQGEKGSMYSVGQKLRIRVGPLKGYLCRVIALRYSDVTVKLDSQHKIFTVKSEHLAEVRDRNSVLSTSVDAGAGSFQPFDMLVTEGSSGDWAKGAGTSGEGSTWNLGGASADLSAWGSKPASDVSELKVPDDNTSTWGNAAAENKPASSSDQPGGWNSWGKTPASEVNTVGSWGDACASKVESSWGKQGASSSNVEDSGAWGKQGGSSDGDKQDVGSRWGKLVEESESNKKEESSWGKKGGSESGLGKGDEGSAWGNQGGGFGSGEKNDGSSGWGKPDGGSSWGDKGGSSRVEPDSGSSWGKKVDGGAGTSWGKKDDGGTGTLWGKQDDGGSSWGKKDDGGSTWGKKDDGGLSSGKEEGGSSWGKKDDGGSTWGKKDDGGSSWGKKDEGGSSWGKKDEGGSTWGKKDDGGSSWGKKDDGGSSWGKKDDGGNSEQTFDRGGRGFRGRGGRRGGRDQFGRGRSFGNNEEPAPWSKSGGGSSWGKQDNSSGGGSSWGKQNDDTSGGSSWSKQNNASGGGSSWGKQNDTGGGGSSWGKQDGGSGGSSWGKQAGEEGGSAWGKQNDAGGGGSSWGKKNDAGGGGSSWGKQDGAGGGSSWGKQDGEGGGSAWGKQNDGGGGGGGGGSSWGKKNDASGGGSSWGKEDGGGSGSSWGKQDGGGGGSTWGKQNDGGGSSLSKQGDGGSKPWGEQSGGRGFGGRRGGGGFRGGYRGGRNQSGGRDGGRSYDRDQSSSWKKDNQETSWKSDQSGGSDWKKPSDVISGGGGGGGNWSSWDNKSGNEKKAAWGTGNDQANTGNNNGGWNNKSNDDVKTGGEAVNNAWGSKPNTGASSSSGVAWGTSNEQANTGNSNDGWNRKPNDDSKPGKEAADNAWGAGAPSSSGSAW